MPCVSPCGGRIGLVGRRGGGNRESRNGRLAYGCLYNVSLVIPALARHTEDGALTVQLMAAQMLYARVTLFTALVLALKLLFKAFCHVDGPGSCRC